jgi:hypothetical protein
MFPYDIPRPLGRGFLRKKEISSFRNVNSWQCSEIHKRFLTLGKQAKKTYCTVQGAVSKEYI